MQGTLGESAFHLQPSWCHKHDIFFHAMVFWGFATPSLGMYIMEISYNFSNIDSRFNATQHKEILLILKIRVNHLLIIT